MRSNLLINEILSKIEFKILPDKNIRKQYIYRIKKRIYKFLNNEKNFINSNTIFRNIDKEEKEAINKLALIDTMSKISIGFIINQICKSLDSKGVYLNIGVWRGFRSQKDYEKHLISSPSKTQHMKALRKVKEFLKIKN